MAYISAAIPENSTNSNRGKSTEEKQRLSQSDLVSTRAFVDLIDGIDLDLDRLFGYQAEYQAGSDRNLSIHEYREALQLEDIHETNSLCFLTLKEEA